MIKNFSNCPSSKCYYGGSERKIGILFENKKYILKFQKDTPFGKRNNHISEYLGSHIFNLLGFDVHETFLGKYKGEYVVACKDFIGDDYQFVPFDDVSDSSLDVENKEVYQYTYQDIVVLLEKNKKLTNIEEVISIFFEMFIVDALIGNFDRHGSNWGFLKKDNKYKLAPIFDNGSSLFPSLIDEEEIKSILGSDEEIDKRIYQFPTSQIKLNKMKLSYFDVISSLEFDEVNKALIKVYPKIDMLSIENLIDSVDIISDIQKKFYKSILNNRYIKILKYSYDKLMEKNKYGK